jgi:GxxExxY protein
MKTVLRKQDLIYPELSYKLIGIAYEVFNELGFGHLEKTYQRAYAKELKTKDISFVEQVKYIVKYKGEEISHSRFDFLVEDKVIIELKKSGYMSKKNIEQISSYIKASNLKLALVIIFTPEGVRCKRVVNDF